MKPHLPDADMKTTALPESLLSISLGCTPLTMAYLYPGEHGLLPISQMILIMLPAPALAVALFLSSYRRSAWVVLALYIITAFFGWYCILHSELEPELLLVLGIFGIPLGALHLAILTSYLAFLMLRALMAQRMPGPNQ